MSRTIGVAIAVTLVLSSAPFSRQQALAQCDPVHGCWRSMLPPRIDGNTAIYDPVRDRMIVVGGVFDQKPTWVLEFSDPPVWDVLYTLGSPPPLGPAIYDPVRDRMIVVQSGIEARVWALDLFGTPRWYELRTYGARPRIEGCSVVYDSGRDQLVAFGGYPTNEVWVMSLESPDQWIRLEVSGLPPLDRGGQVAIYDPISQEMIIHGGAAMNIGDPDRGGPLELGDVWTLSLDESPAVWREGTPGPILSDHVAAYDPANREMIIYGGDGDLEDHRSNGVMYTLPLATRGTWRRAASTPQPRIAPVAVIDTRRSRLVVHGGHMRRWTQSVSWADTYVIPLDGSPGEQLTPGPRSTHSAVYDPVRDQMFLVEPDTWMLQLSGNRAWIKVASPENTPQGGLVVYDEEQDRILALRRDGEVWTLEPSCAAPWARLPFEGPAPPASVFGSAVYDPGGNRVLVSGGANTWALVLGETPRWEELQTTGVPPGVAKMTGIYDGRRNRVVYHSGPTWALMLEPDLAWVQLASDRRPIGNTYHPTSVYDPVRDRMIIYYDGPSMLALQLENLEWTALSPTGGHSGSAGGHSAIYDPKRDRMIVFGGDELSDSQHHHASGAIYSVVWGQILGVEARQQPLLQLGTPSPNPSRGAFGLHVGLPEPGEIGIEIFDVTGRVVLKKHFGLFSAGSHQLSIGLGEDASVPPTGIYFVRVRVGAENATRRVVVVE